MKRSEAIKKLVHKVVSPFEVIHQDKYEIYLQRAETILDFLEKEIGMLPPKRWREKNWNELGITYSDWTQLPSEINEWEAQDE